ncbi:LisH dimerization motif domain containing protein [Sesbania bispinosa]|nr:LisH dimerization motif domain containing protein [Sesbania bispinosa]
MVGLSNLFRGVDRLVFPLPYHFHYPYSPQPKAFTWSGTFMAFPLSFYFQGSVASSAPSNPAYSNQVCY